MTTCYSFDCSSPLHLETYPPVKISKKKVLEKLRVRNDNNIFSIEVTLDLDFDWTQRDAVRAQAEACRTARIKVTYLHHVGPAKETS